ncbi:MAG: FadR/GntR family transcriptional regulator [Desulfobacteraceae bacterium]
MDIDLKPVKPKRISDQVFDQIRELIFRGTLKPGEKLLTERQMAEKMNVSRTTIRDAVHRLVAAGLIEQKQGQGTFVKSLASGKESPLGEAMKSQNASINDLLEVRMGLECNAASIAARRADESDISAIAQTLTEMKNEVDSGRLGTEADTSFHMGIAYATKNPLHVYIMRNFYDYLFEGIKESLVSLYEHPDNINRIYMQHRTILDHIRARDPEKSFNSMREHINFVLEFFMRKGQ